MKRIVIFAGTTEGRNLAECLSQAGITAVVCVATEYGTSVMPALKGITVRQGRMNRDEMTRFMKEEEFLAVVDATHPYAVEVSENIRSSAVQCGTPYIRLERDTGSEDSCEAYFPDMAACIEELKKTEGNILLTTGSKDLSAFSEEYGLKERLYVRVLPGEESIRLCNQAGICGKQIIAMQGPFSEELNVAVMNQFDIRYMVTKESGKAGGVPQKLSAAHKAGVKVFMIGEPKKNKGICFEEVVHELERLTGVCIRRTDRIHISLIGMGMGDQETCIPGAIDAIKKAGLVFGAERLLRSLRLWNILGEQAKTWPYYLAGDIVPVIKESQMRKETSKNEELKVAVVFSGDSGFYSGCEKLYKILKQEFSETQIKITVFPGISSVSCMAAKCGVSWQDACIVSIHGRGKREDWQGEFLDAVRHNSKTFALVSGAAGIREIGGLFIEYGLEDCAVTVGYQISYPEEKISTINAEECCKIEKEGLYIVFITNPHVNKRYLAPCHKDEEFTRGTVPMSKEEVREIVVSKLRLTENAVVYDVGSGTGSVAVEIAERSGKIKVFAIEQKEEGIRLIEKNATAFGLANIRPIEGKAPECLMTLPVPTHAFIGGSSGNLKKILDVLYEKNPHMRVVITAVSMETVSEITDVLREYKLMDEEVIQLQVSRSQKAGKYHLMQAENPVFICSFYFTS